MKSLRHHNISKYVVVVFVDVITMNMFLHFKLNAEKKEFCDKPLDLPITSVNNFIIHYIAFKEEHD